MIQDLIFGNVFRSPKNVIFRDVREPKLMYMDVGAEGDESDE